MPTLRLSQNMNLHCNTPNYRVPAGVFLIALLFYLIFIPNTVYWLDAPEFAGAGFSLGMVHPPGHPVVMLLLRAFDNLPMSGIAFRSNVFSGVFAAMSASILSMIAFCVFRKTDIGNKVSEFLAWMTGIGFAISPALTVQGTGVEVYSVNSFLCLTALYLAFYSSKNLAFAVPAAFFLGLGAANHHYLTILAIPAVVWAAYPALKQRPKLLIPSTIAFILPLILYLYLPIRAPSSPLPSWTELNGPVGLFNYVSAKTFAGSINGFSMFHSIKNTITALFMVSGQFSPLYLAISIAGMVVLFLKDRRTFAILFILIVLNLASKVAMSILDPQNPDAYGYFLPTFGVLFLFAAIALAPLLKTRLRALAIAGAFGLVITPAIFTLKPALHRRNFHDTRTYSNLALRTLPQDSVTIMSFYPSYFLALYDRVVTGLRPDCLFVQASFYEKSGGSHAYATQICRQAPDFCPIASEFAANKSLNWPSLTALAKHRPVLMEPAHGMDILSDFSFHGFFFSAPVAETGKKPIDVRTFINMLETKFGPYKNIDIETRRLLLRLQYLDARLLSMKGQTFDARLLARACTQLAPNDPMVLRLNKKLNQSVIR